jgi:uncharacterized protein YgbK (DUF1537 family)
VIAIVADDLTGACDSASPFLRGGPVQVAIWPHLPENAQLACVAVSTDGRDQDASEARTRARTATAHLMALGARPFKKVDSRMRGHVAAELAGVLDAWPGRVLLCPALPAEGRLTIDRRQVVGEEVTNLAALTAVLDDRVVLRDAASDADLDLVAAEVLAAPEMLPAGSAGLAAALARAVFAVDETTSRPGTGWAGARHPVGLVGSKTEVSAEQLARAVEAGWEIKRRTRHDPVELDGYDALFMSGGSTAHGVLSRLGVHSLELLGDAVPRAPVGRVLGGERDGLLVCVKSGGFGGPDAVAAIFARLVQGA